MTKESVVFARKQALFFSTLASILILLVSCANATSNAVSSTISTLSFSKVTLKLLSYGQSYDTFAVTRQRRLVKALSPAGTSPATSYVSLFQFDLGSGTSTILGFNVYRSSDGSSYTQIGTENYGSLTSTNSLGTPFEYYDYDATLVLGTTYYYKAQAFDASGNLSSMSPVASALFMKPFTLTLTSPSNGTTTAVTSSTRTFFFTLSDTTLWTASLSDYFYFSLFIKDKIGDPVYYGEFRYDFSMGQWQAPGGYNHNGTANWTSSTATQVTGISYSSATISVDLLDSTVSGNDDSYVSSAYGAFELLSGHSYEWDIFGDWLGTSYDDVGVYDAMDSAFFAKATTSASATGDGVSYANTYINGEGSLNGSYSFSY
jgi:hypothetical protein